MRFLRIWRIFKIPPIVHLSAADFTTRLITLIYISILSRELDLKTLAIFLLAQGFMSLPIQFSDGAVNPEAIRSVTSDESNIKIANMIKSKLIISLSLAVATLVYIQIFDKKVFQYFVILFPIIMFQVLNLQFIQQAERKFLWISLSRIISGCTLIFVGLLLLWGTKNLAAYWYLLPYVVSSFISMAMSFRQKRFFFLKDLFNGWDNTSILSILKLTIPTGLVFLFLQFFQYSTLIFHSLSNQSQLLEQVGLNLRVWYILAIPIGVFPTLYLSKVFLKNFHIHKTIGRVFLFHVITVLFSILAMSYLIKILYGHSATQFAHGVSLYILSLPFFAVSNIVVLKLIGGNRGIEAVRCIGIAIICNLVSQSFSDKSIVGIALSWLFANIVLSAMLLVIVRESNHVERVVLISAAGFGNIGDDFILENHLVDIKTNSNVGIICGPITDRLQVRRAVHFISATKWLGRVRIFFAVMRSSEVKFVGGGLFAENNKGYYRPFLRILLISILLRKRVEMRAIQIDDINSLVHHQILRYCLGRVESSSVRDLNSYNNLPPAGKNKFTVNDDLVFFKRPPEVSLNPISLCINLRINADGSELSEFFLNNFASFLNKNIKPTDRVVLLSMMESELESDLKVLKQLDAKLFFRTEIVYPSNTLQAMEVIASSRRVIAMRLHSVVFAAMFGREVLAIPYSHKVSSFAQAHGIACAYTNAFIQPFENWWNKT